MRIDRLLPDVAGLHLDQIGITESAITITITTTRPDAPCPLCAGVSTRVHSRYWRTIADRPWAGMPVYLHLTVRKFFCPNPHCRRRIFAERLPTMVATSARRTLRLAPDQRQLGLDHGGAGGARTGARLGMPTSPDTLLRFVRRAPTTTASTPRMLGVDDWAFRKGRTYGTLLVDLEQHHPVDLLPDRTADLLEGWLRAHPGVEMIRRDRAGAYAEGATRGAPDAIQVADRFHLVQNLREALQRLFDRQQAALKAASTPPPHAADGPPAPSTLDEPAPTRVEQEQTVRRARRHARYNAVLALAGEGWSIRAIAREIHLSRDTPPLPGGGHLSGAGAVTATAQPVRCVYSLYARPVASGLR